MSKELDKEIFLGNFYYLLKTKGIKIGEMEEYACVAAGYFSRLNKDANAKPNIDVVISVADKFEISLDTLTKVKIYDLSGTEMYMINFLEKLKKDTEAEKLMWGKETASELENVGDDDNGFPAHEFFSYEEYTEDRGGDYPEFVKGNIFVSDAFGTQTAIHGDCFNLRMKNGAILFLADIVKKGYWKNEKDAFAKEVWLKTFSSGQKFLCSTKNPKYADLINNLFNAVSEYCKHPQLEADYRFVIDAFMQDDLKDDVDKQTWTASFDDDPPF